MNIYFVLSLAITLNAVANILMKVAMLRQGKTTDTINICPSAHCCAGHTVCGSRLCEGTESGRGAPRR